MLGLGTSLVHGNLAQEVPYGLNFTASSSQYVNVGDDNSLSFGDGSDDTPMTISMWVRLDLSATGSGAADRGLLVKGEEYGLWVDNQYNKPFFVRDDVHPGGYLRRTTDNDSPLTHNTWHHIVVVSDDSEDDDGIKIYIDNSQVSTTKFAQDYTASHNTSADLQIGRGINSSTNQMGSTFVYAEGDISNVAMWNKVLDATAVATLYNGGKIYDIATGLGTNLVAWWPFNEGSGTSAADGSSNSNTGTLTNSPTWLS